MWWGLCICAVCIHEPALDMSRKCQSPKVEMMNQARPLRDGGETRHEHQALFGMCIEGSS